MFWDRSSTAVLEGYSMGHEISLFLSCLPTIVWLLGADTQTQSSSGRPHSASVFVTHLVAVTNYLAEATQGREVCSSS